MCAIGSASGYIHQPVQTPQVLIDEREAVLSARITKIREFASGRQIVIKVHAYRLMGDTAWTRLHRPFCSVLRRYENDRLLTTGEGIVCVAQVNPLQRKTGIPYELDYNQRLMQMGVTSMASVFDGRLRVVSAPDATTRIITRIRDNLHRDILMAPISEDAANFLFAAFLGDTEHLRDDTDELYRSTGIAHILALSGLHVSILVSLLSIALFPLRRLRRGMIAASIICGAFVWGYAIIVGMAPSVVRAATMISVILVSGAVQGRIQPLNTLLAALAVVLVIDPWAIGTAGMHMSFAAVGAIMLFVPLLPPSVKVSRVRMWLAGMVLLPIVAMIGTSVLSMFYFGYFPSSFLLTNVLVAMFFPLLLRAGVLTIALAHFGLAPRWLGGVVDLLYDGMDGVVRFVHGLGIPNIEGIHFSAFIIIPYAMALILGVMAIRYRHTWSQKRSLSRKCAIGACGCLIAIIPLYICLKEELPREAVYIPSSSFQGVIAANGEEMRLFPVCKASIDEDLAKYYNKMYGRFLGAHHCREFALERRAEFEAGGKRYAIIGGNELPSLDGRTDYAVIGGDFRGKMADVIEAVHPDTVVLSVSLNASTSRRLARECGDSVGVIDLRKERFVRVIRKY